MRKFSAKLQKLLSAKYTNTILFFTMNTVITANYNYIQEVKILSVLKYKLVFDAFFYHFYLKPPNNILQLTSFY